MIIKCHPMWNSSSPKLFNAKATSQDGTCPAGKSKFSTLKLRESEWFRLARCHDRMPRCAMTIRWHKVILKIRWRLHMKHVVLTSLKEREWVSFRRSNSAPQKNGVALWCKPLCGIWSLLLISDLILCSAFFGEDVSFEIELFASLSDKHPAYITSYLKIEAYSMYVERRATSFATSRVILCHWIKSGMHLPTRDVRVIIWTIDIHWCHLIIFGYFWIFLAFESTSFLGAVRKFHRRLDLKSEYLATIDQPRWMRHLRQAGGLMLVV